MQRSATVLPVVSTLNNLNPVSNFPGQCVDKPNNNCNIKKQYKPSQKHVHDYEWKDLNVRDWFLQHEECSLAMPFFTNFRIQDGYCLMIPNNQAMRKIPEQYLDLFYDNYAEQFYENHVGVMKGDIFISIAD